jgi:hypothetical protein
VHIPLETFLLGEMLLISFTHFIENASFHFGVFHFNGIGAFHFKKKECGVK